MDAAKGLNFRYIGAWCERYSRWLGVAFLAIAIFVFNTRNGAGPVFWVLALLCMWWPILADEARSFLDKRREFHERRQSPPSEAVEP